MSLVVGCFEEDGLPRCARKALDLCLRGGMGAAASQKAFRKGAAKMCRAALGRVRGWAGRLDNPKGPQRPRFIKPLTQQLRGRSAATDARRALFDAARRQR